MENSKFKTEYKLKQHTMLLHFQAKPSSGENVCLRASEVKPKLDRFILKKLGEIKTVKEKYSSWIQAEHLNEKDVAFKYRMTIKADKTEVKHPNDIPKIYYGNMGDGPKKYGVFFIDGLKIQITCFIPDLKKFIDENIAEFFAVTNFGTMQNKGFGSFTIEGIDEETVIIDEETVIEALKNNYDSKKCFRIAVNQSGYDNETQKTLFETVKQVYSVMKSGQNIPRYPDKYIRSFIYVYMHDKGIGNEKAFMKATEVAPLRDTHGDPLCQDHEDALQKKLKDEQFRYVRAVLGIADKIEWLESDEEQKEQRRRSPLRERVAIEHLPTDDELKIERCSSPVFFKIINGIIYFTADNVNPYVFGKKFSFTNEGYTTKDNPPPESAPEYGKDCTLYTPKNFKMTDFLTKYMGYYNNNINKFRQNLRFPIEEV